MDMYTRLCYAWYAWVQIGPGTMWIGSTRQIVVATHQFYTH